MRIKLFLLFWSVQLLALGQPQKVALDSVLTKVFNSKMYQAKTRNIVDSKRPTIIVSPTNCSGCVKYFAAAQKNYNFVFVLYNESLLEAERIINQYNLPRKNIYFTTCEYIKGYKALCQGPTPCCLSKCGSGLDFYDYQALSNVSGGFSLEHSKLLIQLKCK